MKLLDRLIRRDTGYWEGLASGAAILTTSYGSPDRESILAQVAGWAQQANASDAVVFSVIAARMLMLGEGVFQFQASDDKHLFGNPSLSLLEHPWPNGTSGELIARMEQDASLAGNAYIWSVPGQDRLVRLRPDWVTIVSEMVSVPGGGSYRQVLGYFLQPPKTAIGEGPPAGELYPVDEVAHWAPIPDPQAHFRGMSWLTPVYRDINADSGLAQYKIKYLENNASPNVVIRYAAKMQPGTIDAVRERMHARYGGVENSFKTLVLDQGADLTVIGNSLEQMDFTNVMTAGAYRILAASGTPPLVVGLEPITGAGKSYEEVIRRWADLTLRPLWRSMCGALETVCPPPGSGARLWIDTGDIAALQDGAQVLAQVQLIKAQALLALSQTNSYTPDSAVTAVEAGDMTQLELKPEPVTPPALAGNVQHLLPQTSPGVVADPLPAGTTPRLPVGSTSPGDGGNSTRPAPVASAVRRAITNGHG